jgi:hypothetical protein
MSNLYREPSIDASYQVSVHLAFCLADFLDSSPLKPFGQMNRNCVGSIYVKSSVAIAHFRPDPLTNMATTDNSKLTDDRRRTPSDGKSSHCLIYGKIYLSFNSLGKSYLSFNREDFLEINQSETRGPSMDASYQV